MWEEKTGGELCCLAAFDFFEVLEKDLIHIGGYHKIPKISPGAYIFQRSFLRGLFLEGLIFGGKFAFQNRLGQPYSWKEI